jgi:hypothetical protein
VTRKSSYWKTVAEPYARAAEGLFAFLGGDDEPERPHRVKITDEAGTVKEVFVPPGDIMQFHDWAPVKREFAAGRIERGSD